MRMQWIGGWMVALVCLTGLAVVHAEGVGGAPRQAARTQGDQGADMFRGYCAPCHGPRGVGDGPAAKALLTKPADLTQLSRRNKGEFPAQRVAMVLEFGLAVPAHGSTDMPTWGDTFRVMGDEATVRQRVSALTRYLETIQAK